ncbi:TonB-dependent receptor [Flavobacteriaceae bacterium F89]|uniref:TonB-dependent receptor n=1 Tax=Cerina litoralis TaxID=2874477 RepID=A0AAE3JQV5_9FLAO|nr:TonB-dependent receptor [Cerina litoralis]MCG2462556.1 TonB-dependent receptor [Cerina litoralis]
MYKKCIVLMAFAMGFVSYSQKDYVGQIVDAQLVPLPGATIQSVENPQNGVVADMDGNFKIQLKNDKRVSINYLGFERKTTTLSSGFSTVVLQDGGTGLDEVVVSASREEQRRSEVPASISSLSSRQIERTHAYGVEQLVNQVPGVYMTTSRAASNEQHMMALRSPISTNSIFLYLEDGLPIRPTAVFNHNALLEMNNTSFGRIEVLKGPASSIYGSEAIGGSFNFITKKPTVEPSGSLGFQVDDLGISRYELEYSQYANERVGLYLGTHYIQRNNGPIEYSDYEKFAVTFKTEVALSGNLQWTTVFDMIDYRSDMTGSLSETDYRAGNYESDQTFTQREARAFRARSSFNKRWNTKNGTSFNFIFRNNVMDQNPWYRITQFRENGQLTGSGSGEVNSNRFNSYVGILQHKINFDFAKSSLIFGISADYSPQTYVAQTTDVTVNVATQRNTGFSINQGDYILDYKAGILNYAGYLQYEISPIDNLKVTAALRYDKFNYNYNNQLDGIAGPRDSNNAYDNLSPKLGANYNFSKNGGIYANYSVGFSPPETSTLYRNSYVGVGGEVFDLEPSNYYNYEVGGYFTPLHNLKLDLALYLLDGKNTLLTLRDASDNFFYANAGRTRSYGIEYGFAFFPVPELELKLNGSFAQHRYITFFDGDIDYSDTKRESAPQLLGFSQVSYRPEFIYGFSLTAEHELVGRYNTSFEGQVVGEDGVPSTATYPGYNVFNLRAAYTFGHLDLWAEMFNLFDTLYSVNTSYNIYQNANSYTIGNPRAVHLGIKYNIGK